MASHMAVAAIWQPKEVPNGPLGMAYYTLAATSTPSYSNRAIHYLNPYKIT
jgi:hypothetical protein